MGPHRACRGADFFFAVPDVPNLHEYRQYAAESCQVFLWYEAHTYQNSVVLAQGFAIIFRTALLSERKIWLLRENNFLSVFPPLPRDSCEP